MNRQDGGLRLPPSLRATADKSAPTHPCMDLHVSCSNLRIDTVKQAAALSGVSVRTLHHNGGIDLLKPVYVDANGYRCYGAQVQLQPAAVSLICGLLPLRQPFRTSTQWSPRGEARLAAVQVPWADAGSDACNRPTVTKPMIRRHLPVFGRRDTEKALPPLARCNFVCAYVAISSSIRLQ